MIIKSRHDLHFHVELSSLVHKGLYLMDEWGVDPWTLVYETNILPVGHDGAFYRVNAGEFT